MGNSLFVNASFLLREVSAICGDLNGFFWTMEFSQSWQQFNLFNKLKMFFIPGGQDQILFPRRGGNDGICRLERFFGVTLEESGSLGRYFLGDGDFAEAVEEIFFRSLAEIFLYWFSSFRERRE